MNKGILILGALFVVLVASSGCSTTGHFKIPADTVLKVTDRTVAPSENGEWRTSPFFWDTAGGARYALYDKSGKVIRSGKLKTGFRVASIFWPPFALIYWPMGFKGEYDMTVPGDGYMVRDEFTKNSSSITDVEDTTDEPTPAPVKKKGKKK
ncbi:hypothetical protein WDW86_07995 [Bdellovibrionota bacterium FG-2]